MKLNGANLKSIIQMARTAKAKVTNGINKITEAASNSAEGAVDNLVQAEKTKQGTLSKMLGNPHVSTQERILIMEALKRVNEANVVKVKGNKKPPALNADEDRTPSGNHTKRRAA